MDAASQLPTSRSGKSALDVARACAAEARRIIREAFGEAAVSGVKGRGNVVTETDYAVERATMRILAEEYPDHAILGEETAAEVRAQGWMWVVDPLDGTKNFSRGVPHFCFTIALCHDADPVLGLTLQPLLDEEIVALAGQGVRLNGQPTGISDTRTVEEGVVAVDLGYDNARGGLQLDLARQLWPGMQALRIPGSAALGVAYVALGRWDLFLHADLKPWDLAAGLLMVREAGGRVIDRETGGDATIYSQGVVAAPPPVLEDFLRLAGDRPWRA